MEHMEAGNKTLFFSKDQKVVQLPGETSEHLHERLRPLALNSFVVLAEPTKIETPSWYTFDASTIAEDIPNSVVVSTSTCKHEPPFKFFVGKREQGWQRKLSENPERFVYKLKPLGRELTNDEKNAIYDRM